MQRNWTLRRTSLSAREMHPSLYNVSMRHCSSVLSVAVVNTVSGAALGRKGLFPLTLPVMVHH